MRKLYLHAIVYDWFHELSCLSVRSAKPVLPDDNFASFSSIIPSNERKTLVLMLPERTSYGTFIFYNEAGINNSYALLLHEAYTHGQDMVS